jgi:uncharacterized membrane protein
VLSSTLRIGFAALTAAVCLLAATNTKAEIIFCNEFDHEIWIAIAYPQNSGSFISRGWMSLVPGQCSPFDTAIHVKTFYYRAKSLPYRDNGQMTRYVWGNGTNDKFAIWEDDNFQYYNAQQRVLKSTLMDFVHGPESSDDDVSAKVTFKLGGSTVTISTPPAAQ